MKNLNLLAILAIVLIFSLYSCSDKEEAITVPEIVEASVSPMQMLMVNHEDKEDENINRSMYLFARAIQNLAQNPSYLALMKTAILEDKSKGNFGASITVLAENDKNFAADLILSLNKVLNTDTPFKGEVISIKNIEDINKFFNEKFTHSGVTYAMAIYNATTTAEEKTGGDDVIIAIAESINDNNEVLAYRNQEETPFLLSEEEAINSEDFIIFIGNANIPDDTEGYTSVDDLNSFTINQGIDTEANLLTGINVDVEQFKIKQRFERDNHSEVKGWVMKYNPDTGAGAGLFNWESDFNVRKVHKDDINFMFYPNEDAFQWDTEETRDLFIGTFEKDWYTSNKLILNTCSDFVAHSILVKMKFSHEFYFEGCADFNDWFPNVGSPEIWDNWKSRFYLIRTN